MTPPIHDELLRDAEADKEGCSEGMRAVGGDERAGCGVCGELCSRGGEEERDDAEVAVVAEAVGGYVADGEFFEVGWQWGAGSEEEFVGAAGVFDAGPGVVVSTEVD